MLLLGIACGARPTCAQRVPWPVSSQTSSRSCIRVMRSESMANLGVQLQQQLSSSCGAEACRGPTCQLAPLLGHVHAIHRAHAQASGQHCDGQPHRAQPRHLHTRCKECPCAELPRPAISVRSNGSSAGLSTDKRPHSLQRHRCAAHCIPIESAIAATVLKERKCSPALGPCLPRSSWSGPRRLCQSRRPPMPHRCSSAPVAAGCR